MHQTMRICCLLSLDVPHSHPVGDQVVAGDAEADAIEDHDEGDDGVIVHKGWGVHKSNLLVEFLAKEAGELSHVGEDTVAASI